MFFIIFHSYIITERILIVFLRLRLMRINLRHHLDGKDVIHIIHIIPISIVVDVIIKRTWFNQLHEWIVIVIVQGVFHHHVVIRLHFIRLFDFSPNRHLL